MTLKRGRRWLRSIAGLSMVMAWLVTTLVAPAALAQSTTVISITSTLTPLTVTVEAGTTIQWNNDDVDEHRMRTTNAPAEFDSGNLDPGESFSVTLDVPGIYLYIDDRNDDNTAYHGAITVTEPGGGGSGPPPPPAASGDVSMAGRQFTPGSLTVAEGATVSFVNDDDRDHTVTANDGSFDSGIKAPGTTYTRTFNTAGTYNYFCVLHPDMTGTILVTGAGGEPPPPAEEPPPPPPPAPVSGDVEIVDFAYGPASLTVPVGSTVSWGNNGVAPHTVTDLAGSFDSGFINAGETYSRTFSTAGTFNYFCTIHPDMTGTILVTGTDGEPPPPAEEPVPPPPAATPVSGDVEIVDFAYGPASLTVPVGSTVSWGNNGAAPHTVTDRAGSFDSGLINTGERYSRTFSAPGTFNYFCTLHPQMVGTLVVTDASGQAPPAEAPIETGSGAPAPAGAVEMRDFSFAPSSITVSAGATVTWFNSGAAPHTVTTSQFDSGLVQPGNSYRRTFDTPGTYQYVCTLHPQMTGVVTVTDELGNAPPAETGSSEYAELLRQSALRRGLLGSAGDDTTLVEATMFEFGYDPAPLVAEVGSTVVWSNIGQAPHTVTDKAGAFDSDWVDPGTAWSYEFTEVGEYQIFCTLHPQMETTVRIVEALETSSAGGADTVVLAGAADLAGSAQAAADDGPPAWHQTPMSAVGAVIVVLGLAGLFGGGLAVVLAVARRT